MSLLCFAILLVPAAIFVADLSCNSEKLALNCHDQCVSIALHCYAQSVPVLLLPRSLRISLFSSKVELVLVLIQALHKLMECN